MPGIQCANRAGTPDEPRLRRCPPAWLHTHCITLALVDKHHPAQANGKGRERAWCEGGAAVCRGSSTPGARYEHTVLLSSNKLVGSVLAQLTCMHACATCHAHVWHARLTCMRQEWLASTRRRTLDGDLACVLCIPLMGTTLNGSAGSCSAAWHATAELQAAHAQPNSGDVACTYIRCICMQSLSFMVAHRRAHMQPVTGCPLSGHN